MTKEIKASDIRKGHCPNCGPSRSADVLGYHNEEWSDDENQVYGATAYYILKCRGCETPFFQTDEWDSESEHVWQDEYGEYQSETHHRLSYWPSPIKREQPKWSTKISRSDSDLGALFEDIYGALNADLRVPAAISIRTSLDRASELLGVDPALTFDAKLKALFDGGKISSDERDTLAVLIDAGSAAAHRGWRPGLSELDTMMSLMEGFLHRTFVLGEAAKKLQKSIPPKPKKKPKTPPKPNKP